MRAPLACAALLLLVGVGSAADPKPIEELRILKVGVNTSEAEFMKLHPKALRDKSPDEKYGVKVYIVPSGKGCSAVYVFLDGKLQMMYMNWFKSGGSDPSEWKETFEHMVAKYGKPGAIVPGSYHWKNEDTKNMALLIVDKDMMVIVFTEHERSEKLKELKMK
jgi:hypothetical protein